MNITNIYTSFRIQQLSGPLEAAFTENLTAGEVSRLQRTTKLVDKLDHFTALGFFSISRDTLKSMCSTATTYLIILIQFKAGSPVTPRV